MMMSAPTAFEPAKQRLGVARVEGAAEPPRMTPARARALEIASDGLIRAKSALAAEANCSTGVIDGLFAAGCFVPPMMNVAVIKMLEDLGVTRDHILLDDFGG
jgi:primosomal protein N' (replication factor Y)